MYAPNSGEVNMKNRRILILIVGVLSLLCFLTSCVRDLNYIISYEPRLRGVVKSMDSTTAVIECDPEENNGFAGRYRISLDPENPHSYDDVKVGDKIFVYYNGKMTEDSIPLITKVYAILLDVSAEDMTVPTE